MSGGDSKPTDVSNSFFGGLPEAPWKKKDKDMSIESRDGIGGVWDEDGNPKKESSNQEPLQVGNEVKRSTYTQLTEEIAVLKTRLKEYDASFELYDNACRRGTAMWREETGGKWILPDTAKLVAWLIERLVEREQDVEGIKIVLRTIAGSKNSNVIARRYIKARGWEWKEEDESDARKSNPRHP